LGRRVRAAAIGFAVVALTLIEPCSSQQTVMAPGGVAVGGNVVGSTVNIGVPPEQLPGIIAAATEESRDLSDQQKKEIAALRESLKVTQTQLLYIARIVGLDNVPNAELGPAILERVQRLHVAENAVQALPADNPIKPLAQAATDSGAYGRAERLLAVAHLQTQAVEFVDKGQPDQALGALNEAEQRLGDISMNSSAHERLVQGYIFKTYEQAFWAQGDKAQADQYLAKARDLFQSVARETSPEGVSAAQFASAMNGMGNLLSARGDYRGAIRDFQVAVALAPGYAYAWHDMFLAYAQLADQGEVDLPAMRHALAKTKETGKGWPVLTPSYIAQLNAVLVRVEQANKQGTKARVK
jgi:tetratricopeptide (TPR) repeat protein